MEDDDMGFRDFNFVKSIDFESQRLVDELNAEHERREFDQPESSKISKFCSGNKVIDVNDDDEMPARNSAKRTHEVDDDGGKGNEPEPKKKRQSSDFWNDFTVIEKRDKSGKVEEKAVCNHYNTEYAHNSHKNGTTQLRRHRDKCKLKVRSNDVVAKTIIQHDLPYAYVEYERVREVWKYLNADVKFISRNTTVSDVLKFYEKETEKLKRELAHLPGRICFTSDLWSAITHEGYMCLTTHYVDVNWKLHNKILTFCAFPPPHSGMHIAMKLLEILNEWGVEKKVFSITLDNATNNDNMQEILISQLLLHNDLLSGGEFFHVRCSAHILNLIVQDGLKVMGNSLTNIRESIKYVQASSSHEILFDKCVETVGIKLKAGLMLDVQTRWNSTYHMLHRAIQYKAAFVNLKAIDGKNYKFLPTENEWTIGKMICEFLEPFDEITRLISGSTYPTLNLYFMQVFKVQNWLKEHEDHRNEVIREMIVVMQEKFDKYWEEYKYCFKELDKRTYKEKITHLRDKLTTLFSSYESKFKSASPTSETCEVFRKKYNDENEGQRGSFGNYSGFRAFRKSNAVISGKSTLTVYLEEAPLDVDEHESLDVLKYWKDNSKRFQALACMACDILSIPITTVASESSFSIGS